MKWSFDNSCLLALFVKVGEPWVQGLVEGEYSDLSVEERLSALVALLTVVNEGNAIRVALEVINGLLLDLYLIWKHVHER